MKTLHESIMDDDVEIERRISIGQTILARFMDFYNSCSDDTSDEWINKRDKHRLVWSLLQYMGMTNLKDYKLKDIHIEYDEHMYVLLDTDRTGFYVFEIETKGNVCTIVISNNEHYKFDETQTSSLFAFDGWTNDKARQARQLLSELIYTKRI